MDRSQRAFLGIGVLPLVFGSVQAFVAPTATETLVRQSLEAMAADPALRESVKFRRLLIDNIEETAPARASGALCRPSASASAARC